MLRKIIHIVLWLLVAAYLAVSLSFTEKMESEITVAYINVEMMDSAKSQMVSKDDVLAQIEKFGYKVTGIPVDSINMSGIEDAVSDISGVRQARVFYTPDKVMHIRIWQREPIVRIVSGSGQYYIDEEGEIIQFTNRFTPRVLVITGFINVNYALDKLHGLAIYISNDPFYSSLVQEIRVDRKKNLEIISRIGNHRIFFGPADEFEWKLTKLKAFYEKALPNTGWDRYKSIDLRYSDQVVCKKNELSTIN